MSDILDSDQAGHFVGPNMGSDYLQRLSADDIATQIYDEKFIVSLILASAYEVLAISNSGKILFLQRKLL